MNSTQELGENAKENPMSHILLIFGIKFEGLNDNRVSNFGGFGTIRLRRKW